MKKNTVTGGRRVPGFDLARGLAVLVMVVLNFRGVLAASQANPLWLDLATAFFDRRAAAALVMISGAGVTLYARVAWNAGRQRDLIRRGIFLILAGSCLYLIWSGDILHVYGVLICMGAFLAYRSSGFLFLSGSLFLAGGIIRWLPLFDPIEAGSSVWVLDNLADLLFTGYFPLFPWAGIFISGMLLGRVNLRKNRPVLAGISFALFSVAYGISQFSDADWAWMDLSLPTLPAVASGMGTGLFLILMADWAAGGSIRVWQRPLAVMMTAIAAAGRTSLTFYILHILILVGLAPLAGRSGFSNLLPIAAGAVLLFCLYAAVAVAWLKYRGRGPLEQAMRKFPYVRFRLSKPVLSSPARP